MNEEWRGLKIEHGQIIQKGCSMNDQGFVEVD